MDPIHVVAFFQSAEEADMRAKVNSILRDLVTKRIALISLLVLDATML